jgi:hypothetical protein
LLVPLAQTFDLKNREMNAESRNDELLFDSKAIPVQKAFEDSWPYCSKVAEKLQATNYTVTWSNPLRKFKSGRKIAIASFFRLNDTDSLTSERVLLETRDAMQLISKKTGQPYYVCFDN